MLSTLLALCEGNTSIKSGFPTQREEMWSFDDNDNDNDNEKNFIAKQH